MSWLPCKIFYSNFLLFINENNRICFFCSATILFIINTFNHNPQESKCAGCREKIARKLKKLKQQIQSIIILTRSNRSKICKFSHEFYFLINLSLFFFVLYIMITILSSSLNTITLCRHIKTMLTMKHDDIIFHIMYIFSFLLWNIIILSYKWDFKFFPR